MGVTHHRWDHHHYPLGPKFAPTLQLPQHTHTQLEGGRWEGFPQFCVYVYVCVCVCGCVYVCVAVCSVSDEYPSMWACLQERRKTADEMRRMSDR